MKRWLIIGATGRIGRALARSGAIALTRRELDLAGDVSKWEPPACDVAFLCAGVSSMERCRTEPERARQVNVTGTIAVAQRLLDRGAHVVYLSSNQVFDGSKPKRRGDEPTCPRSEYGRQKAHVEQALSGQRACIVRLTKVLGSGPALLAGWRDALSRGETVRAFDDLHMAPVGLELVIEALGRIAERGTTGIVQVSAQQDVSYADAARLIARHVGADEGLVQPASRRMAGIPDAEAPRYTTLDVTRLERDLRLAAPRADEVILSSVFEEQPAHAGAR